MYDNTWTQNNAQGHKVTTGHMHSTRYRKYENYITSIKQCMLTSESKCSMQKHTNTHIQHLHAYIHIYVKA